MPAVRGRLWPRTPPQRPSPNRPAAVPARSREPLPASLPPRTRLQGPARAQRPVAPVVSGLVAVSGAVPAVSSPADPLAGAGAGAATGGAGGAGLPYGDEPGPV